MFCGCNGVVDDLCKGRNSLDMIFKVYLCVLFVVCVYVYVYYVSYICFC